MLKMTTTRQTRLTYSVVCLSLLTVCLLSGVASFPAETMSSSSSVSTSFSSSSVKQSMSSSSSSSSKPSKPVKPVVAVTETTTASTPAAPAEDEAPVVIEVVPIEPQPEPEPEPEPAPEPQPEPQPEPGADDSDLQVINWKISGDIPRSLYNDLIAPLGQQNLDKKEQEVAVVSAEAPAEKDPVEEENPVVDVDNDLDSGRTAAAAGKLFVFFSQYIYI